MDHDLRRFKAEIFQALANPTRIAIVELLRDEGETSVGRVTEALGVEQANASQHLAVLRNKQVVLSRKVQEDFDRIFDHLFERAPEHAATRIESIIAAIDVLASSPLIGRPVSAGQRELIISSGASGFLALYRYDPVADTIYVLAVRSQRERDYKPR